MSDEIQEVTPQEEVKEVASEISEQAPEVTPESPVEVNESEALPPSEVSSETKGEEEKVEDVPQIGENEGERA